MERGNISGPPYKTYGRSRSLRLPALDYASPHVYFVTIGTRKREALLSDPCLARAVLGCLLDCRDRYDYALYAYCLMPNHVHLLVTPKGESSVALSAFVGAFKSLSTRAFWERDGKGVLWQQHYYDHIVRSDESLSAIGEYILNNPARRGLSSSPTGCPFSGIVDEIPA